MTYLLLLPLALVAMVLAALHALFAVDDWHEGHPEDWEAVQRRWRDRTS